MPTKSQTRKPRTKVKNISSKPKDLSQSEQKRVKGGLLPYIEQDNLYKSRANASLADDASASLADEASLSRAQKA